MQIFILFIGSLGCVLDFMMFRLIWIIVIFIRIPIAALDFIVLMTFNFFLSVLQILKYIEAYNEFE